MPETDEHENAPSSSGANVNDKEDEETLRQRRKEKILASREDRLAKIMSMASGRTVDPKEVHLDRTPSPAAGVGRFELNKSKESVSNVSLSETGTTCTSNLGLTKTTGTMSSVMSPARYHLMIIILAANLLCAWNYYSRTAVGKYLPGQPTWQAFLATFTGLELIEYFRGRASLMTILGDLALFLLINLLFIKLILA